MIQMIVTILLAGLFTENFVLAKFLGICPFIGVSKKLDTAVGMGVAVTFVMILATLVTYPIYTKLLLPSGFDYLQTIVFILVIAALVQLVEIILKRYIKPLYQALGIYLPLITTNCAVLGVTILNFTNGYNLYTNGYLYAIINSLAGGVGFLMAMCIFAGVRGRLETCDIPKGLQGLPITLISAAIVSMSFLGFGGLAEGIFGA